MDLSVINEDGPLEAVLMARPGYVRDLDRCPDSWRALPDPDDLLTQWHRLAITLQAHGVAVHVIDSEDVVAPPDGAFVRDVAKTLGSRLHVTRPQGHRSQDWEPVLEWGRACGVPVTFHDDPATVCEAADLLLIEGRLHVGVGRRTEAAIEVPMEVACTTRAGPTPPQGPQHLLGGHRKVGDHIFERADGSWLPMDQTDHVRLNGGKEVSWRMALNWVTLGPDEVLAPDDTPEVHWHLRKRGITVHELPMDELRKMGGGFACLTLPLRRGTKDDSRHESNEPHDSR